jgi:hypothetical protein
MTTLRALSAPLRALKRLLDRLVASLRGECPYDVPGCNGRSCDRCVGETWP